MSDFYVPKDKEKNVKLHIPFTPYYLYWAEDSKLFFIVEKQIKYGDFGDPSRTHVFRFL